MIGRTYTRTDVSESTDDFLAFACCMIAIMPDTPMTYFVGLKEGFHFYHEGACADAARREVYGS